MRPSLIAILIIGLNFLNKDLYAQLQVKSGLPSKTTVEANKETIKIPIKIEGTWPDTAKNQFKVKINISGDAAQEADYLIDKTELIINKNEFTEYFIKITIIVDGKIEPDETIKLGLSLEDADNFVSIDTNNKECKITITESSETADKLLNIINSDKDTSEVFATIKLVKTTTSLWTWRRSLDSKSEKGKDDSEVQKYEKSKVDSIYLAKPTGFIKNESTKKDTTSEKLASTGAKKSKTNDDLNEYESAFINLQKKPDLSDKNAPVEHEIYGLSVNIKRVEVAFYNGVVSDIKVYTDIMKTAKNKPDRKIGEEIFSNLTRRGKTPLLDPLKGVGNFEFHMHRFPISLRHFNINSNVNQARLYAIGNAGDRYHFDYIKLKDFIKYDPGLTTNYAVDGDSISLTPEKNSRNLKSNTSLRSYINLNIYTDFLSLIKAERGNGLVQTEATSKLYLNTNNLPRKNTWVLNYIEPFIKYSRFDSGYGYVVPDTNKNGIITVNRNLLNQRSFLNTGIKLNVIKFISKLYNELDVNLLSRLDWADVRGKQLTQQTKNDVLEYETDRINIFTLGAEAKYKISLNKNYSFTAGWALHYQELWNRPSYDNKEWKLYHSPEFELSYYPVAKKESKIFLRLKTFITTSPEVERNFVQMQVGYRAQFKFNPPSK